MRPRSIVIIDDELDLCLLMKSFLLPLGFTISTAHTLGEGMELIRNTAPEIIFLDNNLPDGYGWDHLQEIQQIAPAAKIVLMSAFKNSKDATPTASVFVLEKPISLHNLSKFLHNVDKSLQHL